MVAGSLETVKLVSDVASNVVTIGAVLVGGYWAWRAFFRERTGWPKADLQLAITHRELTATQTLLHAKVKVHNSGSGLMKLTECRVDVRQVLPLTDETTEDLQNGILIPRGAAKAKWRTLNNGRGICRWGFGEDLGDEPEIEPGEKDEYGYDFILPSSLEAVYVYVYVKNVARKSGNELGWTVADHYDLAGAGGGESTQNLSAKEAA
jgi:hypothetical protein